MKRSSLYKEYDLTIIGAGILGLSLAWHLNKSKIKVLVLERESRPAQHASKKNAGMVRQLYRHPILTDWAEVSLNTWPRELKESCFVETGSLVVGRQVPGHHEHLFEQQQVPETFNRSNPLPAVFSPTDGLLDSDKFNYALFESLSSSKINFKLNSEVKNIERTQSGFELVTDKGENFRSKWLVNASGAWASNFLSKAGSIPIQPFARHLFETRGIKLNSALIPNVGFYWNEHAGWYMRKWGTNQQLISICDRVPAKPEEFIPSSDKRNEIIKKSSVTLGMDAFENVHFGNWWHCFRTYTPDLLPVWGEDPKMPGLFWLAAFGGFGISTGFAAAAQAAKYISGEDTTKIADFCPGRT